jgi:hypothetical protein
VRENHEQCVNDGFKKNRRSRGKLVRLVAFGFGPNARGVAAQQLRRIGFNLGAKSIILKRRSSILIQQLFEGVFT